MAFRGGKEPGDKGHYWHSTTLSTQLLPGKSLVGLGLSPGPAGFHGLSTATRSNSFRDSLRQQPISARPPRVTLPSGNSRSLADMTSGARIPAEHPKAPPQQDCCRTSRRQEKQHLPPAHYATQRILKARFRPRLPAGGNWTLLWYKEHSGKICSWMEALAGP